LYAIEDLLSEKERWKMVSYAMKLMGLAGGEKGY
jgi:hypothetical protein